LSITLAPSVKRQGARAAWSSQPRIPERHGFCRSFGGSKLRRLLGRRNQIAQAVERGLADTMIRFGPSQGYQRLDKARLTGLSHRANNLESQGILFIGGHSKKFLHALRIAEAAHGDDHGKVELALRLDQQAAQPARSDRRVARRLDVLEQYGIMTHPRGPNGSKLDRRNLVLQQGRQPDRLIVSPVAPHVVATQNADIGPRAVNRQQRDLGRFVRGVFFDTLHERTPDLRVLLAPGVVAKLQDLCGRERSVATQLCQLMCRASPLGKLGGIQLVERFPGGAQSGQYVSP
jgi:hypothetical protein